MMSSGTHIPLSAGKMPYPLSVRHQSPPRISTDRQAIPQTWHWTLLVLHGSQPAVTGTSPTATPTIFLPTLPVPFAATPVPHGEEASPCMQGPRDCQWWGRDGAPWPDPILPPLKAPKTPRLDQIRHLHP